MKSGYRWMALLVLAVVCGSLMDRSGISGARASGPCLISGKAGGVSAIPCDGLIQVCQSEDSGREYHESDPQEKEPSDRYFQRSRVMGLRLVAEFRQYDLDIHTTPIRHRKADGMYPFHGFW